MAASTDSTTINPEVVTGPAVPIQRRIALPPATVCLLIGGVLGFGLGMWVVYYIKRKL